MDLLMLVAVAGIPLVLALYIIDALSRHEPRWHTEEQLRAATGVFWDRPIGHRVPVRVPGLETEVVPSAPRPVAGDATGGGHPVPLGMELPANRQVAS